VVNPDRCIGCGQCENVCPVGGEAAIRVKRSLRVEM
jgi:NAD-dependent dihydropyrimidine dehydrogenase PreA subunit